MDKISIVRTAAPAPRPRVPAALLSKRRKGKVKLSFVVTRVVLFTGFLILVYYLLVQFHSMTQNLGEYGTESAMTYRILTAPCISTYNVAFNTTKTSTSRFIYDANLLDLYDNQAPPCLQFKGGYYLMEISTTQRTWTINNSPKEVFAAAGATAAAHDINVYNRSNGFFYLGVAKTIVLPDTCYAKQRFKMKVSGIECPCEIGCECKDGTKVDHGVVC